MNMLSTARNYLSRFRPIISHKPSTAQSIVSDLFIWRRDSTILTYFDLLSLPSLFDDIPDSEIILYLFDAAGLLIRTHNIVVRACHKLTICINDYLPSNSGMYGTFAIFHSYNPLSVITLKSHLTERGYVSYRSANSPLATYVHGNYDAISLSYDSLKLLGGTCVFRRNYNLQYCFQSDNKYHAFFVNYSIKKQHICCKLISLCGSLLLTMSFDLDPGACFFIPFEPNMSCRLIISSRLVMSRPTVFRFRNLLSDVFHG